MTTSTRWQLAHNAAVLYQDFLVPSILGPAALRLVEEMDIHAGNTVVDVGCGTGAASRAAAPKATAAGRVIALDVNEGMLEVARSLRPPNGAPVEWLCAGAHQLPLDSAIADVVLCAQTLQFVQDRYAALREMRRILKPGGRAGISLWCSIGENPYFQALVDAMARHVGADTAAGLGAAFSFHDERDIRAVCTAAGFTRIGSTLSRFELLLPPPEEFVPHHVAATPMHVGFAAAETADRQNVVKEVAASLAAWRIDGGMRIPFSMQLVTASA